MTTDLTSDLSGKHFFITGASSGIGRHTAIRLARAGAKVHLTGRDVGRLAETISACETKSHAYTICDLANPDSLLDVIKRAAVQYGPFDGFFHSAGNEVLAPVNLVTEKRLMQALLASTFGLFSIARAATKKGITHEGGLTSIVAMSSVASVRGQVALSAYSAAKGSVDAAVRSLATELAPRNIRVNSIIAGAIRTEMHERITENLNQDSIDAYAARHLLGFGSLDDVVNAALFLLSNASKWITGTGLVVDGGFSCK